MTIPKLSKRDRKTILRALETLRVGDEEACGVAKLCLRGNRARAAPTTDLYRDWLYWLGTALCEANVLERPVYAEDDIYSVVSPRNPNCVTCTFVRPRDVEWYWDYKIVLWGVREYVRRRIEKSRASRHSATGGKADHS